MNGLVALNKPSGITSAQFLNNVQRVLAKSTIFPYETAPLTNRKRGRWKKDQHRVKVGHGGTLDPLASGVLVIGIGTGTKQLSKFLSCTKEYEATALFGSATETYDSEGLCLRKAPYEHITLDKVTSTLLNFQGEIEQQPPLYSALRMDGKRLYDYARAGLPLPKEIPMRKVTISHLEIMSFDQIHPYTDPQESLPNDESLSVETNEGTKENCQENLESSSTPTATCKPRKNEKYDKPTKVNTEPSKAPIITFRATVSSGTYIRSLVHDIGLALDSAAHMVKLVRTRQGEFSLTDAMDWSMFENGEWEKILKERIRRV